jgi:putative phage-type endonuclease
MFNTSTNVLIQTQHVVTPETEQVVIEPEQNTDTVITETSEQTVISEQVVIPEQVGMKLKDNLLRLRNRVKALLKKPQPIQRSPEWFANRNTLVTASEAASCLTTSKKVCENYVNLYGLSNFKYNDTKSANSYEKMNDYILKKCKAFYGESVFTDSVYTLWGKKYEQIAVNLYKKINKTEVYDFGLLKHPYLKWLGASPDGITPDGVMLEIKCPYSRKIKSNYIPFHYYIQVQIQLEVALLEYADFMECEIKEINEDINEENTSPPTSPQSTPSYKSHTSSPTPSSQSSQLNQYLDARGRNPAGIIINLLDQPDNSESKYIYQDAFDETDPIIWAKTKTESLESDKYKLIYYYIPNYSILRIKRDREWFNNIKDDIKKVHDKITFFQNNKEEFLKFVEERRLEKNKKHIEAFNSSVCLLD